MKPLICPQCGAKILKYDARVEFADCDYCGTKVLIESQTGANAKPVDFGHFSESGHSPLTENLDILKIFGFGMLIVVIIGGVVLFTAIEPKSKTPGGTSFVKKPVEIPNQTIAKPTATPPSENLLDFGGTGTSDGLFKEPSSIAVSRSGRIYVADETLRVQEFNEKGEFLRVRQIPESGKHYKKARHLQKIAVDKNERLFVLVEGVLQVWGPNTIELPDMTYHAAPEPIVDFAIRSDGGLLLASVNREADTLIFLGANGRVVKRISGFLTDTADPAVSPQSTALAAIRIAVDGAGNIFSVYAFGDLGGYQISYDAEDFQIFRFNAQGKYIDRFLQSMDSVGIETDSQSRVYVTRRGAIEASNLDGSSFGVVDGFSTINAFALDAADNIYVIDKDRIVKRPPVK